MTLLHVGSEKSDGIDHSGARPSRPRGHCTSGLAACHSTRDSRWHPACLQCDRSPGRRHTSPWVDLRQLVEKAQLSGELVTMCLESAFELQAGTSAHTKRETITDRVSCRCCRVPSLLARPLALPPTTAATAGQGPATDTMTAAASQAARRRCRRCCRPLNDALQNSATLCSKQCRPVSHQKLSNPSCT